MAGDGYQPLKKDPAIERWSQMHATMYKRFKWTPSTVRASLALGVVVPYLTYQLCAATNDRWDLRGKRNGESILVHPPAAPAAEEE